MNKISATIVADSICPRGHRLVTLELVFPRFILAELNTHRALSKNSASSRAIPFKKMVKMVKENPFIPIAWQKEHIGMQGTEYITDEEGIELCNFMWLSGRDRAVWTANNLSNLGGTKQLCNRLLEPFMYHKVLISGTDEGWENFFNLRCPEYVYIGEGDTIIFRSKKDFLAFEYNEDPSMWTHRQYWTDLQWLKINKGQAEIHMMDLAEKIWDAFQESKPKELKEGEWHIPYEDKIVNNEQWKRFTALQVSNSKFQRLAEERLKITISTAMCARVSYTTIGEEKEINYENLIALHDRLINQVPLHASPMEHCAQVPTVQEYESAIKGNINWINIGTTKHIVDRSSMGWFRNFHGFKQYRQMLEDEEGI